MLLMQAGDSLIDVLRVVSVLWLYKKLGSCLSGYLKQLVSTSKIITTISPASLQPG